MKYSNHCLLHFYVRTFHVLLYFHGYDSFFVILRFGLLKSQIIIIDDVIYNIITSRVARIEYVRCHNTLEPCLWEQILVLLTRPLHISRHVCGEKKTGVLSQTMMFCAFKPNQSIN